MTFDQLIEHLQDARDQIGGDTIVVLTAEDFIDEGDFFALDEIPLDSGGGGF
jgi:hypothetical protein